MENSKIKKILAREILDSRGKPTVEVKLKTQKGEFFASCPSGASIGKNEAVAVDAKLAVDNVNKIIAPEILGKDETKQKELDELMIKLDGTKGKKNLGANAILPVSIAICRAGAAVKKLPLYQYIKVIGNWRMPRPCFNIINGGAHAGPASRRAGSNLDIQEFMVVPNYRSFSENLETGKKIFNNLKKILEKNFGKKIPVGDEGGLSPNISNVREVLDFIVQSTRELKADIGLDVAASGFSSPQKEKYNIDFYNNLIKDYPIIFIEDPFGEEDYKNFKNITQEIGEKVIIVGDDFLTTNVNIIKKARELRACNGAIIKPNQIGTVTETLEAIKLVKSYNWKIVVSHRSGETMDDFISDLAVGVGADFIKSGAPVPAERLAKYNRLLKIEKELK
ncbi:MAG: phosphopyruvate hydratase [Candidatus Nealsonbacteria bacterium]|nr:phosphopyruvate hydratase [Candidatus Nealsonbacteria bacterium]